MVDLTILEFNIEKSYNDIIKFIRHYMLVLNRDGIVVGLSGGIDSCLVLKLCIDAIGNEKILAIILPERDSNSVHMHDAVNFSKKFRIKYKYIKISPILWYLGVYNLYPPSFLFSKKIQKEFVQKRKENISKKLGKDFYLANIENCKDPELNKSKAFYRIKHRIRSSILFYYSELNNCLFVGTSNKTEWLTGFFVKYGDNIADIMPINNLFKTQVFSMAKYLKVDNYMINKKPSPDLVPGITDEELLGLDYKTLDLILYGIENNMNIENIKDISESNYETIKRVEKIIKESEHLRTWPVNI